MKTSELIGSALDWAVAISEGFSPDQYMRNIDIRLDVLGKCSCLLVPINREYVQWGPSTNWAQGGPIIEREKIAVSPFYGEWVAAPSVGELIRDSDGDCMTIAMWESEPHFYGPTPLIAAMRCYVASKLGDEVEVPKELTC